jgi:hypothetical protein
VLAHRVPDEKRAAAIPILPNRPASGAVGDVAGLRGGSGRMLVGVDYWRLTVPLSADPRGESSLLGHEAEPGLPVSVPGVVECSLQCHFR